MKTGFACPPQIIGAGAVALAWLWTLQPRPAFPQTPAADSFNPGAVGVSALAIQPDGKVLVGGGLGTLAGQPCNGFGRLNADGTFDSSFNGSASGPEGRGCSVSSIEVQADGKLLVGGMFTVLDGQPRSCLGRLNADGTLDSQFNPGVGLADQGPGASPSVAVLAVQADGKILVGGNFTSLADQPCTKFGRLNPSGTLDTSFAAEITAGEGPSLAFQPDGKILVGGSVLELDGGQSSGIGRLNADGSWDNQFSPQTNPLASVNSIAVQADGKILLGGSFGTLDGQPRNNIARLNPDGTVDPSFNPGADDQVCSLVVQANGQILVGGAFQTLGGQPRSYLGRLNPDGTADTLFNPGADRWVQALAIQADGNVLVGGSFLTLAGAERNGLGRLINTETATQALSYDGSTITWLRGGSSPEVWRTLFEASTDGVNLTPLGEGSRVPGGWQLAGASVPPSNALVALGFVAGSECDASGWYVETSIGQPVFIDLPASRTNSATTAAKFNALASGPGPLAFQWLKDGAPLADGGNVSGAQTTALALRDVLHTEAGNYSVVVSNAFGSVTSTVATLTVIEPDIAVQPASQSVELGQSVPDFAVEAAGTPPFTYQWWKDGVELAGGTKSSLALTNASAGSAGNYRVVVSSPYGSVTSAVAGLTVNLATLDSGFKPLHGNVYALALQPDGKILTGYSAALQRLNVDGTLDGGFSASVAGENEMVHALAVQPDGKILVGGSFANLDGHALRAIGRLNSDGTLDTQFDPAPTANSNPVVNALALEPDGEILVAGGFNTLAGQQCTAIGLLNPDGSLDNIFNSALIEPSPTCVAVEADGKILEGGGLVNACLLEYPLDQPVPVIMNADGSLDTQFNGWVGTWCIIINCLVVQPDGKILMGGSFGNADGQSCSNVCRFYPDGTLDTGFNPSPNGEVCSLALQADGKILVGGVFTAMGGQSRNNLARLNADGTLDSQFNPGGADGYAGVYSLALQADGKILVGADFSSPDGQAGSGYERLNNLDAAAQSLAYDGSTITWLRGGSSPEVWCATFEASTNGTVWTMLGQGSRIPGGWQLAFVLVPPGGTIRARGYYSTGGGNASSSLLETLLSIPGLPAPRILLSDGYFGLGTNGFGFNVSGSAGQTVAVDGSGNLSDWLPLATNTLSSGPFYFSDPAAKEEQRQFYRARVVP